MSVLPSYIKIQTPEEGKLELINEAISSLAQQKEVSADRQILSIQEEAKLLISLFRLIFSKSRRDVNYEALIFHSSNLFNFMFVDAAASFDERYSSTLEMNHSSEEEMIAEINRIISLARKERKKLLIALSMNKHCDDNNCVDLWIPSLDGDGDGGRKSHPKNTSGAEVFEIKVPLAA